VTVSNSALARGLQLAGLSSLAVAQPLLDLLQRHPPFLVAHRAGRTEIALLVVVLVLGLPAAAWGVEEILRRISRRLADAVHLAWLGLLVAATALPALGRAPAAGGSLLVALAIALGGGATVAYARFPRVRTFTTVLALAPLVFTAAFLGDRSIAKLMAPPPTARVAGLAPESDVQVVVVVFDELPTTSLLDENGDIDAIRYPSFARLARTSTWLRRASGVHALTEHAIPAVLTGRYPNPDLLPIASDHPQNLFTLLSGSLEMHVDEPFTSLYRPATEDAISRRIARARGLVADLSVVYLHVLLPRDWAATLPPVTQAWSDFTRASVLRQKQERTGTFTDRPERFRDFVQSIAPSAAPTLHFLHVALPHVPWQYAPSGRIYYPPIDFDFWDNTWGSLEWWVVQGYQRHLLQLALVDTLLGELLDRLEATGLWQHTLLIVTADHGASFRKGESRRDPASMQHPEDVLGVPLFVKLPGQTEGSRELRNVETVDVLPTIADALSIRVPWEIDGCSALDSRKLALFGSGARANGLFLVGDYKDLVGRRVTEVGTGETGNARVQVMKRAFDRADERPESFALARITGVLDRNPTRLNPPYLAIALDGRIEAAVPAFARRRGGFTFSAMLPEDRYRPGTEVEIYAVQPVDGGTTLLNLPFYQGELRKIRER
jgi:hypothetical protein